MKKRTTLFIATIIAFLGICTHAMSSSSFENEKQQIFDDRQVSFQKDKHPFLIVTKEMYPALREKSSVEPWKSMKADAMLRSAQIAETEAYALQEYIGAAALAYILDQPNAKIHASRVYDAIVNQYAQIKIGEGNAWGDVVPPMGSFFSAILALDIVHDALTDAEVEMCEKVISSQIFSVPRKGNWGDVRLGTHGTWDIYKGIRTTPDSAYYDGIMVQITPDGVTPITNHYAWERVGGGDSRVSKSGYMDVLEFTGTDNRYYNNERIQKFQRWLFGSSVNCAKEMAIIGDMLPTQDLGNYMLHRRVVNFDSEAAAYAAWFHEGVPAIGHILTYILPQSALPAPKVPSSQIYENGGAFLRDKEDDANGLQLVLYNIQSQDEWHTHNEVNGLALSGLGNRLLVNGGRLGAPVRAAHLNNTLTINGKNHSSRLGGGIVDGFTTDRVDYAVGSSGDALSQASHLRNTILVHSNEDGPGYFIIVDEVHAKSGDEIKNYLHAANETTVDVVTPLTEYTTKIDHYPTVEGVSASFYYLTPAKAVNIELSKSAVADRYPDYPDHNRLEAVYDVAADGSKNLATLVFPFSTVFPKATFGKIEGDHFYACTVTHGNAIDYIFEATANKEIESSGLKVIADFSLIRKVEGNASFYFVKNGTSLITDTFGFKSDNNVTVYADGKEGTIVSRGARVRLMGVEMESIQFTPAVEIINSGKDYIEVQLGQGTYSFR